MIVREALEEYLAAKRPEMRHKTMSEARRILGYFSDFCTERGIELDHIRPRIIYEYTDFLCENRHSKQGGTLSSHTVFLHTTLIKAFLAWCTQDEEFEEYVRPSMVGKIKKPRQDKFVVETFTRDHIDALLKACDTGKTTSEKINTYLRDRNRAIVMLLVDTGIRAAELCGLRMKYLNLSPTDPHIRVFGKNDKWREIGLGERCRKELRRFVRKHRNNERGTDAFVFRTRRDEPLEVRALIGIINQLGHDAGIQGVRCSPHTFRHSYAVAFMRESQDIYRLSKLMGHSSIRITENYLKSFTQQDARRGAVSPLDAAF